MFLFDLVGCMHVQPTQSIDSVISAEIGPPLDDPEPSKSKRGRPRLHHPKVRVFEQKLIGKQKPSSCCKCNCIQNIDLNERDLLFYRRMVHEPNSMQTRWEQISKFIKNGPDTHSRLKYTVNNHDVCQSCITWVLNIDRKTLM